MAFRKPSLDQRAPDHSLFFIHVSTPPRPAGFIREVLAHGNTVHAMLTTLLAGTGENESGER
jgi:hypothetical protein